jgi:adenosine/AMP kinase
MNEFEILDLLRGSAWAALDDTFFALTDDLFGDAFCEAAETQLAANDPELERRAIEAAMRRHPSSRGRA